MPTRKPNLGDRLKGGVFAVVGLGVITGAAFGAVSTHHFVQMAAHAPGVVTRLNAGGSHPEIRFTAAAGQIVSYPQSGMISGYRPGERVSVLYDPRDPGDSPCLNAFGTLWLDWIMLLGLGAVFVGVGTLLMFGKAKE